PAGVGAPPADGPPAHRPRPPAGRPARRPRRPRHRGPPVRRAAGGGPRGGAGGGAHRGAARPLPAPHREVQGDRHRAGHGPGRPRHGPGAGMSGPHVIVMAKSPRPGRVKTRLCPPCTAEEAAAVAAAALADTLDAVAASEAVRKVLALDGPPGPWLPPGFELIAQRGVTFNDRLANAWADAG